MSGKNFTLVAILALIILMVLLILDSLTKYTRNARRKDYLQPKFLSQPGSLQKPFQLRITIITMEDRPLGEMLDIRNKSVADYAQHHGYEYRFQKTIDSPLPVYWKKLHWMNQILQEEECDYVLWMDSDAMVCNPWIPIEAMISLKPEASIFIGRDWPFWPLNSLCAGVFLVKNDAPGKQFVEECLNKAVNNPACLVEDKPALKGVWAGECYEQGVMNQFLRGQFASNLCIVGPEFICNAGMNHCRYNSLFLHCFGKKDRTLLAFKQFLAQDTKLPVTLTPKPVKIALLLTMHGLPPRQKMYSQALAKWSNQTQFPIFIVDSAGQGLFQGDYNPRFQYLGFKQSSHQTHPKFEGQSVSQAFNYFKDQFAQYDLICKITGKYFIPDLEYLAQFIPNHTQLVLQHRRDTLGQNSELFMISPKLFPKLLSSPSMAMERKLVYFIEKSKPITTRLPPLALTDKVTRNDGSILSWL